MYPLFCQILRHRPRKLIQMLRIWPCPSVPELGPFRGSAELFPLQGQTRNRVRDIEVDARSSSGSNSDGTSTPAVRPFEVDPDQSPRDADTLRAGYPISQAVSRTSWRRNRERDESTLLQR